MVFPVLMNRCKSWTIKKAERQRIDAFELWCWRRLLRVPWTAKRSNQSVLKGINPECSLEGLMQKLKLQYFGHLMWRADSLEKTMMLGSNCQHPLDHRKSKRVPEKHLFLLLTMPKTLTVWITINCGKFWKRWEYQTTWPASWKTYMQVRKQQLELDMEQQTASK